MSLLIASSYIPEMIYSYPKEIGDRDISLMLKKCIGVCFIKVYRVGLIVTVRAGKGVLIHKVPVNSQEQQDALDVSAKDLERGWKWSAPCAITYAGPSLGASIGIERSKYIIFLMSEKDVAAFTSGTFSVGINGTGALGPVGRSGEAFASGHGSDNGSLIYAESSGIYGGISIEFTGIAVDAIANEVQYGKEVSAGDIVHGRIPKPVGEVYDRMYQSLDEHASNSPIKLQEEIEDPPAETKLLASAAAMTDDDVPSAEIVNESKSKKDTST